MTIVPHLSVVISPCHKIILSSSSSKELTSTIFLSFNSKLNIIIGNNAQGKTNILESIYLLSSTKSFLSVYDKNLIKNGEKFAIVKGDIEIDGTNKTLEIIINDKGKVVKINSNEIKKLSDYIFNLKVIVFSPDSMRMLKESPSVRRKFLNIELSQLFPSYLKILTDFNKLLKQRNEYLKIARFSKVDYDYLSVLNVKFAKLSVSLFNYRKRFIEEVNKIIDSIYCSISGFEGLEVRFSSNIVNEEDNSVSDDYICKKLNDNLERDLSLGLTTIGPHRDDFQLYLNDNDLSVYGSQGQNRMALLSLKIAEVQIFKNYTEMDPILLFDDIFSELDLLKRNNLVKYLLNTSQTIITTTDINNIDKRLVDKANIYVVENGNIVKEKVVDN